MYCPKCGKQLPDGCVFCDNCGTQLISEKKAAKKSSKGSAVKVLLLLIVIAVIGSFVYPGLKDIFESGGISGGKTSEKSNTYAVSGQGKNTAGGTAREGSDKTADQNDVKQPETTGNSGSSFDESKLSFSDFDFYIEYKKEGPPSGAENLPLGNANGSWKYYLSVTDPSSASGLFSEIGFSEMSVNGSEDPPIKMILHPRFAEEGQEIYPETDADIGYEPFSGGIDENSSVKLTGNNAVIVVNRYYFHSGREYLIGEIWLSEEVSGSFVMTRGQE